MPPLYRMLEGCVYSLTNFLPFLAMALYPFRRRLRFSPAVAAAQAAVKAPSSPTAASSVVR